MTAARDWAVLDRLMAVVDERKSADPEASYVAKLYAKGRGNIAQKVGEEGLETALAAVVGGRNEITAESADLLFHLMILWADAGIDPQEVLAELARREGLSGLEEKGRRD